MSGKTIITGGNIVTDTIATVSVNATNLTVTNNIDVPDIETDTIKVLLIEEKNQLDDEGVDIEQININDKDITNIGLISFSSSNSAHTIEMQAVADMAVSYSLKLPSIGPTANQILSAASVSPYTTLQWKENYTTLSPSVSRYMAVAKYGNDTTGDGSVAAPFLTLKKALESCESITISLQNPLCIFLNPGLYIENNSTAPLNIPKAGINITSDSVQSCFVLPNTVTNTFITCNFTSRFSNVTIANNALSTAPTALTGAGIILAGTTNLTTFSSTRIYFFGNGITCGGSTSSYQFDLCTFRGNYKALNISNSTVLLNACTIQGSTAILNYQTPANQGIIVDGSLSIVFFTSGFFAVLDQCFVIKNGANCSCRAIEFRNNKDDCVIESGSSSLFEGCVFKINQTSDDVHVKVGGSGTNAKIIACAFDGRDLVGVAKGKSVYVYDQGTVDIVSSNIEYYETAMQVGIVEGTDTSNTQLTLSAVTTNHNVTNDILQYGTTLLTMTSGEADGAKITINDPTNVSLWFLGNNTVTETSINVGALTNVDTTIFKILNTTVDAQNIRLQYLTDIHDTEGLGVINPDTNNPFSFFNLSYNDSIITAVTNDNSKISRLSLVSDLEPTTSNNNVRGWYVDKTITDANLSFQYQNTDTSLPLKTLYELMVLDGNNANVIFPDNASKLLFGTANDTNLYRALSNTLKTDGNMIVGGISSGERVLTTNSDKQITASDVTVTELSYLENVTSNVQDQLNDKMNIAGATMTGNLVIPIGSVNLPSLSFNTYPNYGISLDISDNNSLSISTNALNRFKIDADGVTTISNLGAGIVHAEIDGVLSSSSIVNNDIANGTVQNIKLATLSSTDSPDNIVLRDSTGNFAANMISLNGVTTYNTDVATKAYVDSTVATGFNILPSVEVVSVSNVSTLSGTTTIDGFLLSVNDRILLQNQTNEINNGVWVVQNSSWTRPSDFDTGDTANRSYVLVNNGNTYIGSSWVCATPLAIVGTDNIEFDQYSQPVTYSGNNLGSGQGIYKNNTGTVLNFKSIVSNTYLTVTSNVDDVTLGTNATADNDISTLVARDENGNFAATTITANLSGSASLNVLKSGDVMTGSLTLNGNGILSQLPLNFSNSQTTTGMFATSNNLSLVTDGVTRLEASNVGVVSVKNLTVEGIVHNTNSGALTSSLIVNADINSSAGIVDTKLATIATTGKVANTATTATSINTNNAIVARDSDGNFTASTITATLNGSASANVLKAGDEMTGNLILPTGTTANPSLTFNSQTGTGISSSTDNLAFSTSGNERMSILSSGTLKINAFSTAGVLHSNVSGNITNSLVVDADISASAAILDTKLATINTTGKVANSATTATSANTNNAIVARDSTGNFSANNITASLVTANIVGNVNGYSNGSLIGVSVLTSGTSYVPTTGTKNILIEMVGGGGGGAPISRNATSTRISISSGGGGGAYLKTYITNVSSSTSYTYSIGAAGSGTGTSGGNTTITILGTTYTAQGGTVGVALNNNNGAGFSETANSAVASNGNILNRAGEIGNIATAISNTVGCSGSGGNTPFGIGGSYSKIVGVGENGSGYGSGGAGAFATATSVSFNGGNGTLGVIIIYEYYAA